MPLDVQRRFLGSKTYGIHVNASITVKVLGGISVNVIAGKWQYLKDTFAFLSFLLCVRIELASCSQVSE